MPPENNTGLPILPIWIPPELVPPVTRIPADSLPATPPRGAIAIAGEGSLVPEAYGRVLITRPRIFTIGYSDDWYWFGALWCAGEVEKIESIWDGDTLWKSTQSSSVHTNYNGTPSQTYDAKLAAYVAGYSDDMAGLCYTAMGFHYLTPVKIGSIRAIIQGKKIYDPRIASTVYSSNFALMFRDLAVSQGLSVIDSNIIIAADFNDEDLGGNKRRWGGLLFDKQETVDKQLELLAEHAGCFYIREGGVAKLIPDAQHLVFIYSVIPQV